MNENKKMLFRIAILCIVFLISVSIFQFIPLPWYVQLGVYLLLYVLIGLDVVQAAVGSVGRGQLFDENFLMVLATVGAFATRQYPEAVVVMLLYQIGELFQSYAVDKSRGSISALMELCPEIANVLRDGVYKEVAPEEVAIGETILVRAGERVPLDGVVIKGESLLDTAALTGESIPRPCAPGDEILSGMIVSGGALEIRVEKEFCESTVSKILDMVENAAGKKANTEKFITKFARFYTPVVVIIAVVLALVPPIVDGQWSRWISRAMNFLVVSCPCALVISVPMSFFAAIGAASRRGILVKGGNYLELLDKADIFVFDKTGTLTEGTFSVVDVIPAERRDEILRAAAIAEQYSTHPIARSILTEVGVPEETGWQVEEKAGFGVAARKGETVLYAGNLRYMLDLGLAVSPITAGKTVVYVAADHTVLGSIIISDVLRQDAAEVIRALKQCGVKTAILTGDRHEAAMDVAAAVGADSVKAQLLPEEKIQHMEKMLLEKSKGSVLAFVGDGINDAPVLMRADLGIAMGGIGSDAAIEAADIVLMHDQLSSIVQAKHIAKKTMSIVRQNIVFAIGIKLLVLALTPFDLVSVWLAIFADVGVAVLAILNAMRAGKGKRNYK